MQRIKHLFLLLLASLFMASVSVVAAPKEDAVAPPKRSKQSQAYYDQIQAVLAEKAFGEKEIVKRWRLKEQQEKDEEESAFAKWLRDVLNGWGDGDSKRDGAGAVAKGIEVLLWALVIGLIVYVLVKYRTQLTNLITGGFGKGEAPELPTTMFGLDVKKTSLPEDVVETAKTLWQTGQQRQAVAMLLRASLIKLLHEHQCVFQDSDTEMECCAQIAQQAPKKISDYMHALVQVWQQLAYGHKAPTEDVFNTLCQQWQEVF